MRPQYRDWCKTMSHDVLILNSVEAARWTGTGDLEHAIRELSAPLVDGCLMRSRSDQVLEFPAVASIPDDASGAADVFAGVFAAECAAAAATFDDGVKNGAALAGRGIAEEQPILLSDSGRPNGVFHEIVVDLDATLFKIDSKQPPVGEPDKQVHLLTQQFDFLTQTRVLSRSSWSS
jgi:hypothetical protein